MKHKILLVCGLFLIIYSSCHNRENQRNKNQETTPSSDFSNRMKTFAVKKNLKTSEIRANKLEDLPPLKGSFISGIQWKDKNGKNYLVFTKEKISEKRTIGQECENCANHIYFFRAYHYTGDASTGFKLLRKIKDWNLNPCISPSNRLEAGLYENSVTITDLDKDQYAEATFMYYINCFSEKTPVPSTLIMTENSEKHAIKGTTWIEKDQKGGEMNADVTFDEVPDILKSYAIETWKQHTNYPKDGITSDKTDISTIENIQFKGTSPCWSLILKKEVIEFIPFKDFSGDPVILKYKSIEKQGDIYQITGSRTHESISDIMYITIKKEPCDADGEKDELEYSVKLRYGDETKFGCGKKSILS